MVTKHDVKDTILPRHFNSISDFQATNCYPCPYFSYQEDRNGEIAVTFCSHGKNLKDTEGNTRAVYCPLVTCI